MKNLKSVIVNGVLVALGVLFIGFMAGAYLPGEIFSGYDLLSLSFQALSSYQLAIYAFATVLALVCAAVVVILATLNLLVALGVIKNEQLAPKFNKALLVLTVLAVVFVGLSLIGYVPLTEGLGWGYAFIINLVVVVAAAAVAIYNHVTSKKENKQ